MNPRLVIELEERRRMEEVFQEREAQYRSLLEEAPIGFCIVDPMGTIQYVNRWIEEKTGWTRDDLIGRNGFTMGFFDDETSRLLQERLAARLRGETDQPAEIPAISREGRTFRVEVWGTVLRKNDMVSGVQFAVTGVADRRLAEEARHTPEERYRNLLDMLPQTVFETDEALKITFVNGSGADATGYTEDDFRHGVNLLDIILQRDHPKITDMIKAGPEFSHRTFTVECTAIKKDGLPFPSIASLSPVTCDGRFTGLRGIFTDITEQRRIEAALRNREREIKSNSARLMEMNTALKVLISNRDTEAMEQEEKILTNVRELVLPYLSQLKKTRLDPSQSTYIKIIEANLNTLISPFLRNLTSRYLNLTTREIQLAYLIKEGKTTKEISELLNLSARTIDSHRDRIRKKLGLNNSKISLKAYLLPFI